MAIREVQLFDNSVKSRAIAPDTVVAADIDETVAYNFSNTSSSFAGILNKVQAGVVNVSAGSTIIAFPRNFSTTPLVIVTPYTTSTAAINVSVSNTSTANFTLNTDTSGSYNWIAIEG